MGILHSRVATVVAACAACAALVVGVVFGTYVVGGSDSSCYLNAARLFAGGAVGIEQPLVRDAPWPHAASTFTPTGFTPSNDPAWLVPICSPEQVTSTKRAASCRNSWTRIPMPLRLRKPSASWS